MAAHTRRGATFGWMKIEALFGAAGNFDQILLIFT